MHLKSLQDLYLDELSDIYDAEQQILQALPKMAEAACDKQLKDAFQHHLEQTQTHVKRLEKLFQQNGQEAAGKKCKGMEGLLAEGRKLMREDADEDVKDAALISAAQRVEHYEMAAYGTVRTFAKQLGLEDQAKLLQTTLDEEGATDKKLTKLAESRINREAAGE